MRATLIKDGVIQIDSDYTLAGGIAPNIWLPRNKSNLIAFHSPRAATASDTDIELEFAVSVLEGMMLKADAYTVRKSPPVESR